ncbi:MAG: MBL fold metallo-hydrolase [Cellvibrionaceae bacterium]
MTGPGTNTFLIGTDDITVVDPGPLIDSHVEAILSAGDGKIKRVVVTHTHPDHSPSAKPIALATGAELIGSVIQDDGHQDRSFEPTIELKHCENIVVKNNEYTLKPLHTPGHVGNHFCFWLAEDKMLFTGDHIMQGTTVVIIPPSGDMADYIRSLKLLLDYDIELLAPAHGHLMGEAHAVVQEIIDHRLGREEKVVAALKNFPNTTLDKLMETVYADVDKRLFQIAKLSLWAHLLKLEKDKRAVKHAENHWLFGDEVWSLVSE